MVGFMVGSDFRLEFEYGFGIWILECWFKIRLELGFDWV